MRDKKKKKKHPSHKHHPDGHLLKGTLEVTRSGIGYVVIADGSGDVLVRPYDFNTALNGDTVQVKVVKENPITHKKEGRIAEIVERKQTEFIGTLQMGKRFAFVVPDSDRPMPDMYIAFENINEAKDGDKVSVRLTKWEKGERKPEAEVTAILKPEDVNDSAMKNLIAESGFPLAFGDDVLEEAARLPETIAEHEIKIRRDFRDTLTITIDPVDAKDFDDAISIRTLKGGWYEVGVHIADVSHYVTPQTALDEEGYKRATSVYLPDRVNPMLPEHISNVLCSLRPHEDKLTFSSVFQINKQGKVKQYWLGKTVIHSNHRFTYEEVQEIIEGGKGEYKKEILLLNEIAQTLRMQRFAKGAINFSSQEVRFKLDEKGKPVGIEIKESKEAHQLIEELMLLANRTVAENVSKIKINKQHIPFPYRVHDTPDEDKLKPFIEFAKKFGHKFDISTPDKIAESFNTMLDEVQGKPEQHVLEQLGIRTMAKATYTTSNIGHYGLGFENYCHFTSPIRRYPDVLAHRVLESCLQNTPIIDKKMEEKCRHCSERERAAMECERAANKYKQVEYMRDFLGEEFEGVISGVTSFGFFVETVEQKCEGLVSINSLTDFDDFRLIESDYSLVGLRSGRRFGMGDKVWIKVVAANLDKRQLDYEWVPKAVKEAKQQKEVKQQKEAAPQKETKQRAKPNKAAAKKEVIAKAAPAKKAPADEPAKRAAIKKASVKKAATNKTSTKAATKKVKASKRKTG
ncbi:ribonuclease R [Ilyomonas limi]|uniref:Ribonuclease R n=1 Tax=Ilyomonas limi TaxID=2575867 RepID=A0A4U3L9Q1_9BACT|nr:ribonuclease R [Ilyomonas limi]TKK71812.1 ribonuclease R [Ilyomonas limi]